jgi:hypothetical protein
LLSRLRHARGADQSLYPRKIKTQGSLQNRAGRTSPQNAEISIADGGVINLCANNYLGSRTIRR